MGTKGNPGHYDCYANAESDEPMFILLARDVTAPELIRAWVRARKESENDDSIEMHDEALQCAHSMEQWREKHRS